VPYEALWRNRSSAIYAHIIAVSLYEIIKPKSMPKVELGRTFWVVAGVALKQIPGRGLVLRPGGYCVRLCRGGGHWYSTAERVLS
jgi:hypothetical protein